MHSYRAKMRIYKLYISKKEYITRWREKSECSVAVLRVNGAKTGDTHTHIREFDTAKAKQRRKKRE